MMVPASSASNGKKGRVLLVDDEEGVLITLQAILEMDGYEVATAASGPRSLEMVAPGAFDMVVCDLNLGDYDGRQVLAEVRRRSPATGRLLLTGYATAELLELWEREGETVLVKPADLDAFKLAVALGVGAARQRA